MKIDFKKLTPHFIAIVTCVIITALYFSPQLSGKTTSSGDLLNGLAKAKEMTDYKEKTGEVALWSGSVFSGMPAYQVSLQKNTNMFKHINKLFQLYIPSPIGMFVLSMILFYLSLVFFKVHPWIAVMGAFAFTFNNYNLMIYEAGHYSKVGSVVSMLPILVSVLLLFQKKYINGFILFAFSLALNMFYFHVQMTYYFALFIGIYMIFELVESIKKKELNHFFKVTGLLVLGAVLALATSSSKTLAINEYAKETMRGEPILESKSTVPTSSSETKGLEWNYAMSWSNGIMDVLTMYIPGVVGGSSNQPVSSKSNTAKEFKKFGQKIEYAPLYWGAVGSASGPAYVGSVIMLLFVLGFLILPNKYRFGFGIALLVGFSISLGKNFEFFNRILFNLAPLYSKFRAHSSVMAATPVLVVFLAVLSFSKLHSSEKKDEMLKKLYIATGILASIALFLAVVGSSFFDFSAASDAQYAGSQFNTDAFVKDRIALMRSDSLRSLFFVIVAAGIIYGFLKGKLNSKILLASITLLSIFDIWGIDKRYFNEDDFVKKSSIKKSFIASNADKQILKDTDIHYRVFNQTQNPFNENFTSYFHKSVGGYHPAKLQRYQDIIDYHLSKGNMKVFNMLNTKYFITQQDKKKPKIAQQNPGALGNAWFVSNIKNVNTANEEIEALNDVEISKTAVIHSEFENLTQGSKAPNNASIILDSYSPNELVYTSNNDNQSLAVFSEVWYTPSKGWKAFVDGKETDLIRANYVLRAMNIPAGKHEIRMVFNPKSLSLGFTMSLISSILVILLAIWGIVRLLRNESLSEKPIE